MKVEMRDVSPGVRFQDLAQGEAFIDPGDNDLHIKTATRGDEGAGNAVRLWDGEVYTFKGEDPVLRVRVKVVTDQCTDADMTGVPKPEEAPAAQAGHQGCRRRC